MFVPPKYEDVRYADIVVIGQIDNYRVIRDEAVRKRLLSRPNLPVDTRKIYQDPKGSLMSDYARFDIKVEAVLIGQAPERLDVTWDNSTFGEPEQMRPGRYLIALRRLGSPPPPLRGPSATLSPDPDPSALSLLQAPCSSAFVYEVESAEARAVLKILHAQ
jgi:hypothetical protein